MIEQWQEIEDFRGYSISDHGRVRADRFGRILSLSQTQWGLVQVGLMRNGIQCHRSVPLLVAKAFLPYVGDAFDTPINLDGDRWNNHISNLAWRPRWFAVKYNQQFAREYRNRIHAPVVNLKTNYISENSFECIKKYGLLEEDLVESIINRTYVWPIYQEFAILDD